MNAIKIIRLTAAAGLFVLAAKDLLSEKHPEEEKKKESKNEVVTIDV